MGIAHRKISRKYPDNSTRASKILPPSTTTLGKWIQAKRREKNLATYHLAGKIGIPTALVQAWENGTEKPTNQQCQVLSKIFGSDSMSTEFFAGLR